MFAKVESCYLGDAEMPAIHHRHHQVEQNHIGSEAARLSQS
jgi:hypothetical protein